MSWGNNPNQPPYQNLPNQGYGGQGGQNYGSQGQGFGNQSGYGQQGQHYPPGPNQVVYHPIPNKGVCPYSQGSSTYQIRQVSYIPTCRKCNGSGQVINRHGYQIPCRKCYRQKGICTRCYGSGWNQRKNRPCRRCDGAGLRIKRKRHSSSSSSSSDSY